MTDEAFALSPIAARAAQPSEEDYEAISQAFMETSRGRWFLGEYARRNRNADTRMVLDAVSRIEENLAAQRHPVPDAGVAEVLAAIRSAVDEAKTATATADSLELEQHLGPIHKSVRIIREIGWRLREIGADGRIWDLIDSQLATIETGCGQIASADPKRALSAALGMIEARIDKLDPSETKPTPATDTSASASISEPAPQAEVAAEATAEADDGYDDTMLDMVAIEMAASDSTDPFDLEPCQSADPEGSVQQPPTPVAGPGPVSSAALMAPTPPPPPQASSPPRLVAAAEPTADRSLGSTLIAHGLVEKSRAALSDPLAPIRRMSQVEKIAFFS